MLTTLEMLPGVILPVFAGVGVATTLSPAKQDVQWRVVRTHHIGEQRRTASSL